MSYEQVKSTNKQFKTCCKVFYVDKVEPLLFDSNNIRNLHKNNKDLVGQFSGVFLLRLLTCSNSKSNANCRIIYEYAPSKFIVTANFLPPRIFNSKLLQYPKAKVI